MDITTTGQPCVYILWRAGMPWPVVAAWNFCVAAHWSKYHFYKQASPWYDLRCLKATLNPKTKTQFDGTLCHSTEWALEVLSQYHSGSLRLVSIFYAICTGKWIVFAGRSCTNTWDMYARKRSDTPMSGAPYVWSFTCYLTRTMTESDMSHKQMHGLGYSDVSEMQKFKNCINLKLQVLKS